MECVHGRNPLAYEFNRSMLHLVDPRRMLSGPFEQRENFFSAFRVGSPTDFIFYNGTDEPSVNASINPLE